MLRWIQQRISARKVGIALAVVTCAGIAAFVVWYSAAGKFPAFPSIRNEYVDLGQAILQGQVSLLEQPDPRLATLSNPYDSEQRVNIPYHWDASYYHAKYYIYWGPVPALIAAALQAVTNAPLPGPLLLVIAYVGLLVVFLGTLIRISGLFSGRAAALSPGLFVLLGFVSLPLLYILGVSILIYLGFASLWMWREAGWKQALRQVGLLLAPMAVCLVGLGLYNYVRFGNPLEMGVSYITIALTAWTAVMGFMACFGLDNAISRQFDPAVLASLAASWNPLYEALHRVLPGMG